MSDDCIISADFASWRTIQGRRVLQLVMEIPIERGEDALRKLGLPMPGESKWCAIALLENNGSANVSGATSQKQTQRPSSAIEAQDGHHGGTPSPITVSTAETGTSETQAPARKSFASLTLTQQSGIRCADALFQEFLKVENEKDAAEYVRLYCGIASRSELPAFPDRWHDLEGKYQSWLTDRKFAEAKR